MTNEVKIKDGHIVILVSNILYNPLQSSYTILCEARAFFERHFDHDSFRLKLQQQTPLDHRFPNLKKNENLNNNAASITHSRNQKKTNTTVAFTFTRQ
jgi:hypothetical protein